MEGGDVEASQEVEKVKKTKAKYERLGQTRDTPPEGDALRRFYSSLYEENPRSLMARRWLMMHGLLDLEEVDKVLLEVKSATYNRSLHETRKKVASMLDLDLDFVEASQKNEINVKKEKNAPKKRRVKKEKHVALDTKKSAPPKDQVPAIENGRAIREEDSSDDEDIPLAARRTKAM